MKRALATLFRGDVLADVHIYGGLVVVVVGVSMLSVPWACIVGGGAFASLGLYASRRPK